MPPPAHLAHGGVVSLVGIQLVLDELRQHGVVFVVPAEGGGGNGPSPLSPGNLVSPRVPPRAPLCRLPPSSPAVPHGRVLLQRGAQRGDLLRQPLQDRVLHLGLVGAVKALEGVGRIQGVDLGSAAGGRLAGPGRGGIKQSPAGWGTQPKPRQVPGPGCRFGNVRGVLWGFGCHHCALSPSPAPAPWCSPWARTEPPGAHPAPAHSIACAQAGNQGGEEEQGQ